MPSARWVLGGAGEREAVLGNRMAGTVTGSRGRGRTTSHPTRIRQRGAPERNGDLWHVRAISICASNLRTGSVPSLSSDRCRGVLPS